MDLVICDGDNQEGLLYLKNCIKNCIITSNAEEINISAQDSNMLVICPQNTDSISFRNFLNSNKDKNLLYIIGEDLSNYQNSYLSVRHCTEEKTVRVRTFGRFEVFINNSVLDFHSSKAKELFALCIDHVGGNVSIEEAVDKLWSDRPFDEKVKKLYRKAVMTINKTFEAVGITDVFQTSRGFCRVNVEAVDCDYYSFLKKNKQCFAVFDGEYMTEYDWGEETLARLTRIAYMNF